MPNPALDNARSRVAIARQERIEHTAAKLDAYDNRQEFALTYTGYRNGQHWGRLPNGGQIPVISTSNGSIPVGTVFTAVRGVGGKLYANWLPQ